jgi:hypothetical protein
MSCVTCAAFLTKPSQKNCSLLLSLGGLRSELVVATTAEKWLDVSSILFKLTMHSNASGIPLTDSDGVFANAEAKLAEARKAIEALL